MTDPALLLKLHARLVLDHRAAFTGTGPRNVCPTLAGRTWLADYERYRAIYRQLRREGQSPDAALSVAYGCSTAEDEPGDDTPPHDNGRTVLRLAPDLRYYEDKEVDRGPEAA